MSLNLMLFPTLALAISLAWAGGRVWRISSRRVRWGLVVMGGLLAVPGLLMAAYYLHAFEPAAWFYEFRSAPGSELSAAGLGFIAGIGSGWLGECKQRLGISRTGIVVGALGCLLLPYAKPVVLPADYETFRDQWDGVVCRQSTAYSCGPASAATILGHGAREVEIARQCYTSRQGTENWYLARLFRERGWSVQFMTEGIPASLPTSCIAGVRVRGTGHFIAIVRNDAGRYVVGDPMVGEKWMDADTIRKAYDFTGFFMCVRK